MFSIHKYNRPFIKCLLLISSLLPVSGCKKLISINPPINSTGNETTFKNDANATSALMSVYSLLMSTEGENATNGGTTIYAGLMADELTPTIALPEYPYYQFYTSHITLQNGVSDFFWRDLYKTIFYANSVMEGAAASTSPNLTDSTKRLIAGETRAARAFCYYYLINLYGPVPMPLTSDVTQTTRLKRSSLEDVTKQMIVDLSTAVDLLPENYKVSGGEKLRINKWAATALLSRAYLFDHKWGEAIATADKVINSGKYNLAPLNKVFQPNSDEAIWQLKLTLNDAFSGLYEPDDLVGIFRTKFAPPGFFDAIVEDPDLFSQMAVIYFLGKYHLTNSLVDAFEPNDQRKLQWMDSIPVPKVAPYYGKTIYESVKHEKFINEGMETYAPPYYNVLRLAEQYLIRAEAKAQIGDINGAAEDLNIIRKRAGLPNTTATTKEAMLTAIYHERQTELFCEWGTRFIDLKRLNKATEALSKIDYKQPWSDNYLLLPLPTIDIVANPELKQNTGY
ncbi:RagB/SusD family nutrient uptake outer membrane protein [Chitinophaga silvatica]|uniref:RagB/SusD family nutrient uptake outer membrane protein n=1 Tax=Chitinophaga silvatica TaxID=2282649 RepID=A0A3E1Y2A2_9BACT|nr:RagB/SusD family nutrient uptake outer membrane protein [Chitinophaga silvatica]RFS18783.1 RagB/SusD family nutrient uptake outer membrane protein [Chitinophaga silvatica]